MSKLNFQNNHERKTLIAAENFHSFNKLHAVSKESDKLFHHFSNFQTESIVFSHQGIISLTCATAFSSALISLSKTLSTQVQANASLISLCSCQLNSSLSLFLSSIDSAEA